MAESESHDEAPGEQPLLEPDPELATLRRELAASQARERALMAEVAMFRGALDAISDAVNIRGRDAEHLYANPTALAWMNVTGIEDIAHAERRWRYLREDETSELDLKDTPMRRVLKGDIGDGTVTEIGLHIDDRTGSRRWLLGIAAPIYDKSGDESRVIVAAVNVVRDITAQRANEQALALRTEQLRERDAEKAALISELEALILELSAPALEVWDGILVVPVIGALDVRRGHDLLEGTLTAVRRHRARVVIVDLTGARVDSATSAEQLARLARTLNLLGTECVLAGISPALARFLIDQDLEPEHVRIYANLKYALRGSLEK
jgi:rsbT co-antagonist protein RsbR